MHHPRTISELFKTVSLQLIKSVGGAAGPLYGTFFLKMSSAAKDKDELTVGDVLRCFQEGVKGIQGLGKAEVGEKTMMDTWVPALKAMEASPHMFSCMFENGVVAAKKGMESTILLLAKKGRASYLGERSVGHQDPGATSSYLLLKSALQTFVEE